MTRRRLPGSALLGLLLSVFGSSVFAHTPAPVSPEMVNLRIFAPDSGSGAIGALTIPIRKYLAAAPSGDPPVLQKP